MSSVTIGGTSFRVRQWPEYRIEPAIKWVRDGAGNWHSSDRTHAQDIYGTKLDFVDTEDKINSLANILNSNRNTITLSGFNFDAFPPNVNQTGSITCAFTVDSQKRRVQVSTNVEDVYSLSVDFRAIGATVLGTTPSLSTLRLVESITPDHSWDIGRSWTKSGAHAYADYGTDVGILRAGFSQTTTELKAILAYLLTTARGASITLPTFTGLDYPFGYSRGTGTFSAKILNFDISRRNLNRWGLNIDFAEVA